MTKYIYRTALLAFASIAFVSCDEDTVDFNGTNFVSFSDVARTGISFRENSGIGEIPVNLAVALDHDLTVNFTIESDAAVEGEHYNVLTPSVTIPAGELTASIRIQLIDNDILNDSKPLQLTLTTASDSNVTVGLADAGSKSKRILIVNDDCTTNFDIWAGDIVLTINGTAYSGFADYNEDGDCNTLVIDGTLHTSAGTPDDPISFTFEPNSSGATSGTITAVQQLYQLGGYEDGDTTYDILYSGTGTYNETTQTISLTSSASVPPLGSFADQTVTITPAP